MVDTIEQEDLNAVYPGRTLRFEFEFKYEDGTPMDVSGKTIWFTAKINNTDEKPGDNDIQASKLFPSDADSAAGIGSMQIPPRLTKALIPGRNMFYDFTLVGGVNDIDTLGSGQFMVLQNTTNTMI